MIKQRIKLKIIFISASSSDSCCSLSHLFQIEISWENFARSHGGSRLFPFHFRSICRVRVCVLFTKKALKKDKSVTHEDKDSERVEGEALNLLFILTFTAAFAISFNLLVNFLSLSVDLRGCEAAYSCHHQSNLSLKYFA